MDNGKTIIDWKNGIPALQRQYQQPAKTAEQKFLFWLILGLACICIARWIGYPPFDGRGFTGVRILRTGITAGFDGIGSLSIVWALVKVWNTTKDEKKS